MASSTIAGSGGGLDIEREGIVRRWVGCAVVGMLMTAGAVPVSPTHVDAADVGTFRGLTPARLLDTRTPFVTVDGQFGGIGAIAGGGSVDLVVSGRGGVPDSGVAAVALNVTVTRPAWDGFVTVFPTGAPRPNASNLNYVRGQTVPNMVIVGVGAGGAVTLFSSHATHLVVDVLGWFPAGGGFQAVTPARLLETRWGRDLGTVDGRGYALGAIQANEDDAFTFFGRGGLPAVEGAASAVALNVTSTQSTHPGYFTVYPHNASRSTTSNLNFAGGQTVPNMVIVPLPPSGTIHFYNGSDGPSHIVVDLPGWFAAGPSFTGLAPQRLMDTRTGETTVDGQFLGAGAIGVGEERHLRVIDRAGIPVANVGAVALNVTVTNPTANGYLTVYPSGVERPTASNLNFSAGQTVANMVIVPVGANGEVSLFNFAGRTDVVVDVLGWFPIP